MLTVIVILTITTSQQGLELHPFLTWLLQVLGLFAVVIQSFSHAQLLAAPWTAAHQASLSFTISRSLLKLTSIESVMPSKHLILCHALLLLPSIFPRIRVFSNMSWLFSLGDQSIGALASVLVLRMNIKWIFFRIK